MLLIQIILIEQNWYILVGLSTDVPMMMWCTDVSVFVGGVLEGVSGRCLGGCLASVLGCQGNVVMVGVVDVVDQDQARRPF